ncbi:hypothetical protein CYMTET_25296 [Cymbomonas tetramitiformis]|uniref:Major facilitator superfamily (MFS) profile domain-containing protein n=1 Tax=Cymbomonas tetramitiformis TaxID=36881 RepID=A0AAE0KZ67_9CHLO|nr:hypothetical protein CYMTET_25296 [Cymbomonas tetramitiformis]
MSGASQLHALFTVPKYRRALALSIGLLAMNQLTAINTVMYYGATIMEKAGFSESSAVWLSAGCNLAQALGVCYCVSQMDKVGRRDLALRSSKLVTIALVLLSTSFIADPPLPWLTMPLVMFYLLSFGSGLSGVPWAINSEVFPLAVRGVGSGMAIMVSWLCNFLVSLTFLDLCRVMTTSGAFALFASVGVVGTCAIQTSMPETMGMTLEQIELVLSRPLLGCWGRPLSEHGDGVSERPPSSSLEEEDTGRLLAGDSTPQDRGAKAWASSALRGGNFPVKLAD